MKIFIALFVLILGLTGTNAKAQEPTPTPTLPRVTAMSALASPTIVRLGSNQSIEFQFWIFNDNATIPAQDVILTAILPPSLTFVSASATGSNRACDYADGKVTCNLGTVEKHPYDYSAIVKIYCTPTVDGSITLTGSIKGSNTLEANFSQTKTVDPPKSRKRARFI